MGLGESKEFNKEFDLFSIEEKTILKDVFTKLSQGNNLKTNRRSLEKAFNQLFVGLPAGQVIARRICDLMTGQIPTNNTVTIDGYIHCAAAMIKGMLEDQATELMYLSKGAKGPVSNEECLFISSQLIQLALHMVKKLPAFQSWDSNHVPDSNDTSINRLASALVKDLEGSVTEGADRGFDRMAIHAWLSKSSLLNELFHMLSRHIFQFPVTKGKYLIPMCRNLPSKIYPSWLTLPEIIFINSALPKEYQSEWRFLFSSRTHGESFSSLMGNIIDKGPSLVFIKDVDGFTFGGFASTSWTIGPQFKGTRENFVFSLAPEMAVYSSTGFNDHYQYLNIQQQTFPNGMGFGGQLDYFAIWIDSEYGKGRCAPSCTTYNCRQLSAKPEFHIDMIEVWAVGPEIKEDEDEEKEARPSILDVDVEGTAMLRMMNRGPVSEGMRDNPTSDDPEEKELYVVSP